MLILMIIRHNYVRLKAQRPASEHNVKRSSSVLPRFLKGLGLVFCQGIVAPHNKCIHKRLKPYLNCFLHQDVEQVGVQPDCHDTRFMMETDKPRSTRPTPDQLGSQCPPVKPAEVICNCQTQAAKDVGSSGPAVTSPDSAICSFAAMLVFTISLSNL